MPKLPVALLGLGRWGSNIAATLRRLPNAELVGTFDPSGRRLPDAPAFDSAERLLRASGAQAALIASPPETHADLAMLALQNVSTVFVEKPFATNLRDATRLAQHARERVMVGHLLTYHPSIEFISDALRQERLGAPTEFRSYRISPARVDAPCCWWNLGVHDLCLCLRWFGTPTALRVQRGTPTVAELLYVDGPRVRLEVSADGQQKRREFHLSCSSGEVVFNDLAEPKLSLASQGRAASAPMLPKTSGEPLLRELAHFVDASLRAEPFRTDAAEGLRVVRLLELGQWSMDHAGAWTTTGHSHRNSSSVQSASIGAP